MTQGELKLFRELNQMVRELRRRVGPMFAAPEVAGAPVPDACVSRDAVARRLVEIVAGQAEGLEAEREQGGDV